MNIEGKNAVREALASGKTIDKIYVTDGVTDSEVRALLGEAKKQSIRVEFADKRRMEKISETGKHQNIIAIVSDFVYSDLDEVVDNARNNGEQILLVILDNIEDPHNLGSVIRVVECAGATAVVIPNRRSAVVNETVVRVSAGATNYVPVCKVANINRTIENLKEKGVWVYAADMDGKLMYDVNLTGDIALVIGAEGDGVSSLTRKVCDDIISIPMSGKINSLNASVSAGIVLYEAVRQRG